MLTTPLRFGLVALATLAFIACQDGEDEYTYEYDFRPEADVSTRPGGGGGGVVGGGSGDDTDAGTTPEVDGCPPRDDSRVEYESENLSDCSSIELSCSGSRVPFVSACGCGCAPREFVCLDEQEARYSSTSPSTCASDPPVCFDGETAFSDACGCGCEIDDPSLCSPTKFFSEGPADFGDGSTCEFLVVCTVGAVPDADVASTFEGSQCGALHSLCPSSAAGSCVAPRGSRPTTAEIDDACELSLEPSVIALGCALEAL